MFSIIETIKNNRKTHYNFRTDKPLPVWRWYVFCTLISATIPILIPEDISKFVESVITAQSILVGFSFSVLFFLLSEKVDNKDEGSIEKEIKSKKLNTLSRELFYNVSYFNLTALLCLCFSLIIILHPYINIYKINDIIDTRKIIPISQHTTISETIQILTTTLKYIIRTLFCFTLIESIHTFARTIRRAIYYFEKTISNNK